MNFLTKLFVTAVFLAGAAGIHAQEPTSAASSQELSESEIKGYSAVYRKIERINKSYSSSMEQVETSKEAKQLQNKAQANMEKVIKANGLTIEEYNTFFERLQNDKDLQARFLKHIQ